MIVTGLNGWHAFTIHDGDELVSVCYHYELRQLNVRPSNMLFYWQTLSDDKPISQTHFNSDEAFTCLIWLIMLTLSYGFSVPSAVISKSTWSPWEKERLQSPSKVSKRLPCTLNCTKSRLYLKDGMYDVLELALDILSWLRFNEPLMTNSNSSKFLRCVLPVTRLIGWLPHWYPVTFN